MVRTQVYLTDTELDALAAVARQTGRSQSELIREAIDRFLEGAHGTDRQGALRRAAGLWADRSDLPDFRALRRELDRAAES
jgi:Arc/MetJ-type ribon-helix-helix transcriptional regulator